MFFIFYSYSKKFPSEILCCVYKFDCLSDEVYNAHWFIYIWINEN